MSSSWPSTPAYIVYTPQGWKTPDLDLDGPSGHPAIKSLYKFTVKWDSNELKSPDVNYLDWCMPEYKATLPNGDIHHGAEAWKSFQNRYAPFSAHFHEPRWAIAWRNATNDGWDFVGHAIVYFDFPVQSPQAGPKVKDLDGKEWDICVPGIFKFEFIEVDGGELGGLKFKGEQVCADNMPVVQELMKRGMIGPDGKPKSG